MNLTWHIIKKDLRRGWVGLMLWALTGLYITVAPSINVGAGTPLDYVGMVLMVTHIALVLVLIPVFIQEDGTQESTVFWRTRPISPGRLLTAKLLTVLTLFVVLPLVVWMVPMAVRHFPPPDGRLWVPQVISVFGCIVVSCAALASCTKEVGRYFLALLLCFMVGGVLMSLLVQLGPPAKLLIRGISQEKSVVTLIFCTVIAGAILYLQYFKRWQWISVGLIAFAVVGCALIGAFWTWDFI